MPQWCTCVLCCQHLLKDVFSWDVVGHIGEALDVVYLHPCDHKVHQFYHILGLQSVQDLLFYHPHGTFYIVVMDPSGGQLCLQADGLLLSLVEDLLQVLHKL